MSRQIQDKNSNVSHISSANQIKLRVSPSPKNRPARLGTRSLSKSPTQNFIHNNSKIGESNISKSRNLKNKKDIRAEVSPRERIELIQGSNYEGRQREKSLKQTILNNGSFVQNTNKKSQNQSGELIKKLVSKKRLKLNVHKDTGTKELLDKRPKEGFKKEEQEAVSNYLDLPNNFMASLSFAKNMQTSDLRKKEAKLSASLMPNPTDYKNIIHQSDSHFQSLTNVSRNASIYMLSRHGSHKFTDLEMESDLTEKRIGAYAKNLQESDALSSNAYRLFKYQKLQEKAKLEAVNHPEAQEVPQGSSSIIKSPIYSNKISPRKQSNEVELLDNTTENHKVSHKGNHSKKLKKRKKDGFSPNKFRNFSAAVGERSTEIFKNGMQSSNISQGQLINASILQNEISRQSPYILAENKDLYCEPSSSSFVRKGKKDTCISPNNQQSIQIFQKERVGTEPKYRATAKMQAFFRENAMSPQRVVDLDQMNVKQLIELKNIIDEKIEVEELRNKTDHIKTEQKIKKALKSQGDETCLHKRSQFDDLEMRNQDENVNVWDPTVKNLKKHDRFYEQSVWRGKMLDQRIPRNNRQGVSFNISYMKDSDLSMKHDISSSQMNLNPSLQAGYSYSYVKEDRSLINSKSEIEGMYHQKLKEFLEARDRMLQMTEASGEEVDLGKYSEIPNTASPMEIKSYGGFITLNNLMQVNSPGSLKESESQIIKQKERELLIQSMVGSPSANNQTFKQRFSNSCLDNIQEYMETAKFEEDAKVANTKGEEKQNKQFDFGSLKVQVRSAIQNNDLMSLINQNDKRSKHKTEKTAPRHKSSEVRSRLTKKDIKDLILKANEIEDTPSESIDDSEQKRNHLRHNFGLSKDNLEHKSLAKILNSQFIAQDDLSVPDTPTTNLQNLDSKNTSSIVETDLSILAINKKLAMMRSDLD